jgi:nicotinamide mononucleotide (NMN) deamidase PncC
VADSEGVFSQKLTLDGDRSAVRHGTVLAALTLLLEHLLDEETDL